MDGFSTGFQIDLRRANDTEIMLTKVNIPLADMMVIKLLNLLYWLMFYSFNDNLSHYSLHHPGCSTRNG